MVDSCNENNDLANDNNELANDNNNSLQNVDNSNSFVASQALLELVNNVINIGSIEEANVNINIVVDLTFSYHFLSRNISFYRECSNCCFILFALKKKYEIQKSLFMICLNLENKFIFLK